MQRPWLAPDDGIPLQPPPRTVKSSLGFKGLALYTHQGSLVYACYSPNLNTILADSRSVGFFWVDKFRVPTEICIFGLGLSFFHKRAVALRASGSLGFSDLGAQGL